MTSREIRQSFLDFFKSKEHRIVPSASVVTHGDPTLMFINAGMNQFKDVFLGTGKRDYVRAADTQKCIRVSGKHNDLEEVGVDTYHHTFFEMLGNWSFGDYYKREAIDWAWELLTKVWKLDPTRLHATCYKTDHESYKMWLDYLPEERIQYFDDKDNFWEMGETGPCGPCSEIHYDKTPNKDGGHLVNADSPDVIEIWNLVFIQYNRKADGSLEDLAMKHVDTGMGFERICAIMQDKPSNYDTDVFMPLINELAKLSGKSYKSDLDDPDSIAMRVIADHVRTLSFAIADGAIPSNEGRGYVLRRILRRACRFTGNLGFKKAIMYSLVEKLIENMSDVFPELLENKELIINTIKSEEEAFITTLDRGLTKFEELTSKMLGNTLIGSEAFLLYDTFGFPIDLTQMIAKERNIEVDIDGFNKSMEEQRSRARAARKSTVQEVETLDVDFTTEFTGYSNTKTEAKVLWSKGNKVILDKTPFYVEGGGQISDIGIMQKDNIKYEVIDVQKIGEAIIHILDRDFEGNDSYTFELKIQKNRRMDITRNHTSTHIMHAILYKILGSHIKQAGSLVTEDYLRFDFNHYEKISNEQIVKIETLVNKKILENLQVSDVTLSIEEAQKNPNIKMFFGDKYGDTVRLVSIEENISETGYASQELCGGCHVSNTSEIGLFKITAESSVAAGVRRIEAVTGSGAVQYVNKLQSTIEQKEDEINAQKSNARKLEKEIDTLKKKLLESEMQSNDDDIKKVGDISVVARIIDADNMDILRDTAISLRDNFGKNGIALIAMTDGDKVQLACSVTDDLVKSYPAGKLVGLAAKELGGGGGGKPHLATAGGRQPEKLEALIEGFVNIVANYS